MNDSWEWELIAKHDSLTEGPTWDGSGLLYNECYASTSYRWDPKSGESEVWRTDTNQANGMKFDRSGRLFACEGGGNRVVEIDAANPDSDATVIADNLDGARLNMPNDLDIDGRGRIYFSDPNYSANPNNLPHESVYLAEHIFGGNWDREARNVRHKPSEWGVAICRPIDSVCRGESGDKELSPSTTGISNQLRRNTGQRRCTLRFRARPRHRRHGIDDGRSDSRHSGRGYRRCRFRDLRI